MIFKIITCGLGGEWSGKAPICRYVDCGTPVRPDRGSIQLVNGTTTVGSIAKYQVCSFIGINVDAFQFYEKLMKILLVR